MGSPATANRGSAQLLLLFLFLITGLHLSGAQSPAPVPSPTPAPVTVAPPILPAQPADALPPPPAVVADAFSFSFDFTDKSNYRHDDLKFDGDAAAHPNQVDLTCNTEGCDSVGRVSYGHPVPLYDSATGEVASFQTSFSFSITTDNYTTRGDGMAFFLAYFNSPMPSSSSGGCLGLTSQDDVDGNCLTALDTNQFLAVEFDTFHNTWDPNSDTAYDHIGIDINSMISLNPATLTRFNMSDCSSMTATITFNSTTQILVTDLVADLSDDAARYLPVQMSTQLLEPLNRLFPAQVAVGISGANGTGGHVIWSWSFNSSLALPHKGNDMKAAIIGGSTGGVVALVVVVWCILSCFRWKKCTRSHDFVTRTGGPRQFNYRDLAVATNNFSGERVIGRGAFGVVYRATLISKGSSSSSSSVVHSREPDALSSMESGASSNPSSKESDGGEVAVKKILNEPRGGNLDFFAEMSTISAAKHKNLVKLKGWCCKENSQNMLDFMCWSCRKKKDDELFLVYELVPNGNLHYHLRESEQVIAWPTRYQIIKDIGSALIYLHHDCAPYILHRDIKPSNILLDNNFNAKLADFGLSRIGNQDNATLLTNAIGTEGYIDPECRKVGKVKFYPSSDVYSFGIVLLDIVCTGKSREQVWEMYMKGKVVEAADGRLHGDDDMDKRQMQRVAILGLWCSLLESSMRPTVRKAMEVLERDEPLPDLNYLVNTMVPSAQQDTYTISSDQHALMSDGS